MYGEMLPYLSTFIAISGYVGTYCLMKALLYTSFFGMDGIVYSDSLN